MSGPSDKARFYLEQSIPELEELERKNVFSQNESSSIAKKRSDFEHVINSRDCTSSDYARYIEYEINLEALRRKRIRRLGIRALSGGQRRIFSLFSRGTRKFSGDIGLWMQYVEFARKEKAYKRLNEILTSVVRLHPARPEVWTYAARYFMDTQADVTNARSYMQRGLRFCKLSKSMWLEYAKLEMLYIAKIHERQKILGLNPGERGKAALDDGMLLLPQITAEDVVPNTSEDQGPDEVALQNLASAPVFTGAIPLAIFDAAMKNFGSDTSLAAQFFDMFMGFDGLPCTRLVLQHVAEYLQQTSPHALETTMSTCQVAMIDIHASSPGFPKALNQCLQKLGSALKQSPPGQQQHILPSAIRWILLMMRQGAELDPGIGKVLAVTLRKYCKMLNAENGEAVGDLAQTLVREGLAEDALHLRAAISDVDGRSLVGRAIIET